MQPARRTSQWVKSVDVLSLIDGVVHVTTKKARSTSTEVYHADQSSTYV